MRRVLAVAAAVGVLLVSGIIDRAVTLDGERADAVAEAQGLLAELDEAQGRSEHLQDLIDVADDDVADREAVLAVRPAFSTEIDALGDALGAADGKIDTAAALAAAKAAQQTVLDEHEDPAVVQAATATVHALTAKVDGDVASWQASVAAVQAGPGGPVWSSSGPEGYAKVRAALDAVGGAGIGLYESSSCAGGTAAACANSNGFIKYRADIVDWSVDRLRWAMAHELAHIYQFRVWGALNSSSTYRSSFGGDPEFLANCMAVVRGFPGSVGCDAEQQAWASGIWVGTVR